MSRTYEKVGISLFVVAICALLLLSASKATPQDQVPALLDPLVGTWNVTGVNPGSTQTSLIVLMSFNPGGTTIEYDTAGTNSFASPGEGLVMGVWKKTGHLAYTFKEQNYIFDASGNLAFTNISACDIALAPTLNSYTGTCKLDFFTCSLALCPGQRVAPTSAVDNSATRFE